MDHNVFKPAAPQNLGTVLLYQTEDGRTALDVRLKKETAWLSLTQMVELFERDKSVISRHLGNIFREGELAKEAVVAINATTASDGTTYQVEYYKPGRGYLRWLQGQFQARHPIPHLGNLGAEGVFGQGIRPESAAAC